MQFSFLMHASFYIRTNVIQISTFSLTYLLSMQTLASLLDFKIKFWGFEQSFDSCFSYSGATWECGWIEDVKS